jgi:hypothetical protein
VHWRRGRVVAPTDPQDDRCRRSVKLKVDC